MIVGSVASADEDAIVEHARTLPPVDPTSEEAALLARAIRALRVERDGAAAMALLEAHRGRFADGAFAQEAALLRAEAEQLVRSSGLPSRGTQTEDSP